MADDAYELALEALGRKERSTAEIAAWLRGRGVPEEELETAISRLTELGELDDARFARRYAEDKRELAGWGAERIRDTLLARGVPPEDIEAALAPDSDPHQVERAAQLLVRRGRPLDSDAARSSALGFLTRKGYSYEIAYEAIRASSGS
jgi:regulatory protein